MKRLLVLLAVASCGISFTGTAEEVAFDEIVVTATKTEQEITTVGSSVTTITREEIENAGYRNAEEALRGVPGLTVISSGPFGGMTDISIRGSQNYGHTLVLIDGVPVNDPISIQRSYDFAHISSDNIERIEVVRGPQSTLYGSDAMAGVINIITRKGTGERLFDYSFWGGQHNTFGGSLGLSGGEDRFNYSFSSSWLTSDGISKAVGGEDDAYKRLNLSTRMGYKITENAELGLSIRYTDAFNELDSGAFDDNPDEEGRWKNIAAIASFTQAVSSRWDHRLSLSYSETERQYENIPAGTDNTYKGNLRKLEWQNNLYPSDMHTITAGIEYLREEGYSEGTWAGWPVDFPRRSIESRSIYLQNQVNIADSLYITPGIRIDDNEIFGTETTYRVAAAYIIEDTGTRLKATYGTGFKAPTLFQLYDGFSGNTDLNPETSTGYDFGFEQELAEGRLHFGATYFANRYEDMIDWVATGPWTGEYQNFARVDTSGFEVEAGVRPIPQLNVRANYTYTDTEDRQTGEPLLRRPEHKASLITDWQVSERAALNIVVSHVGEREDAYWDPATFSQVDLTNPGYTKVDIHHSYKLNKNLSLFARVENIFDEDYQEIAGYSALGRSFYAGVRGSF